MAIFNSYLYYIIFSVTADFVRLTNYYIIIIIIIIITRHISVFYHQDKDHQLDLYTKMRGDILTEWVIAKTVMYQHYMLYLYQSQTLSQVSNYIS